MRFTASASPSWTRRPLRRRRARPRITRRGAAGVSFAAVYVGYMTMTEADVVEVLDWLDEGEVAVWLMGGWGVDALVGEQTREHEDLDLIVRDDEVSRMSDVLYPHGFLLSRGAQGGLNLRDERDRLVDVHPVRFDDRGNGHFEQDRGSFEYRAGAFAAAGTIAGRRFACLSAEAQMTDHALGYTPGDTDFHDMRLLNARLGTALLPPYIPREPVPRAGAREASDKDKSGSRSSASPATFLLPTLPTPLDPPTSSKQTDRSGVMASTLATERPRYSLALASNRLGRPPFKAEHTHVVTHSATRAIRTYPGRPSCHRRPGSPDSRRIGHAHRASTRDSGPLPLPPRRTPRQRGRTGALRR